VAFSKDFERELDNLFRQRTHWLRVELVSSRPGKPPQFNRQKVDKGIERLQRIASDALAGRLARTEFEKHVQLRKNWHVKGRGLDDRKARFERWFASCFPQSSGCLYAFWNRKGRSEYVGRSGSGGSRPSSHFDKFWFAHVKRVTIFQIPSASHIPKLACLAIHHFQPLRNKNKASIRKWTKSCPLCDTHRYIEEELRRIFRFK
jgi:hypothetical protein